MAKRKTNADIILCDGCIAAIRSRGEKILKGDSIEWVYETPRKKCEWCEEYYETSELFEAYFRG